MRVTWHSQPDKEFLGGQLSKLLASPNTTRFWAASAWVRRPALRRLEPELKRFTARVKPAECRGLFGVDLGGTTREGLQVAAKVFGRARVFHSSGVPVRTFHPKVYLFEQASAATILIGSPNLTTGGFWSNFEAGVLVDLVTTDASDLSFLTDVREWYERWWNDPNGSRPVNAATIAALEADPSILLPSEGDVRKVLATRRPRPAATSKTAFPKPVAGLMKIPKPPVDVDQTAERDEQPTILVPGLLLNEIETPQHEDDLRVLLAGIPFDRWKQVGFNRDVAEDFFHVYANGDALWVQGVSQSGEIEAARQASLIFPKSSNQNHRIEFREPDGRENPRPQRAILVVLERSFRTFRYMSLRPGDAAYSAIQAELTARPRFGFARKPETKRVAMTYGELKGIWPGHCPLRAD
jgi:hypothetical protein